MALSLEMAPYLLLGFLVAGLLHVYMPPNLFSKWFGKRNFRAVVGASLMGIPLPLCSCGVIPTGISLHKEGASKGSTVSFLISTPQTGVDSVLVTYSLLGLPFAILRPIIALITGILGGQLENATNPPESNQNNGELSGVETSGNRTFNDVFKYAFGEFLEEIADWLIIGILLAGVVSVLIPESFFDSVYFSNTTLSMLIVLVASIPFYVCATGSVPLAAALLMKGLNPGAVLVFLMAGPATNIATMTVISNSLGRKTMLVYMSSIIVGALFFGYLINAFFPADFFSISSISLHHHEGDLWYWINWSSLVILSLAVLNIYRNKIFNYIRKQSGKRMVSQEKITVEVQGMTCEGCKAKVESSLTKLQEVNESLADIEKNTVELKGNGIDLENVKKVVEEAGYHYGKVVDS